MPFICSAEDNTPPQISNCPSDKTITVELGEDGSSYSWTQPTAKDDSGNVTLVSQNYRPGFVFGFGPNTVTYVFADPSGNRATCDFVVTVESGKAWEQNSAATSAASPLGTGLSPVQGHSNNRA